MPLTGNVSENIHELTHHGSRPRSHEQIVAIAMHAAHKAKQNDDHHADAHIGNAHPHQSHSERHHALDHVEVNPNAKTFHVETGVVGGTPHGQYRHHVHTDRQLAHVHNADHKHPNHRV